MKQLSVSILIFFLLFHVKAQRIYSQHVSDQKLQSSTRGAIGIITVMLIVVFLTLSYVKFCHRQGLQIPGQDSCRVGSNSRFSGIDPTAIASLPFFRFSSLRGSKEGLECAVCISRYEESELLRLIPKCKHAFHKECIDKWLENHSTCPLCRYKLDPKDPDNFTYSKSLRYLQNPSDFSEDPNLELFVQREQDDPGWSSRFSLSSISRRKDKGPKEEMPIEEGSTTSGDRKLLHKFKHKIIVSEHITKNRWSDLNSSDLLSLNSEMLGATSSRRLSPCSSSRGFGSGLSRKEIIETIKEDGDRKIDRGDASNSVSNIPVVASVSSIDEENPSKMLSHSGKRSMSEITDFSRFRELRRNRNKGSESQRENGNEERTRRLWLVIARRTVQWFAGRETNLAEPDRPTREASNV